MFTKSAHLYDAIYSFVDYKAEAELLRSIIREHKKSEGNDLLDVACGTGQHIALLRDEFVIEGLDIEHTMLDIARVRNPGIVFHRADMMNFDLQKQFDAIVCMFSSIGFVKTVENLSRTAVSLAKHLKPGAVLIIEPWVQPDFFQDGHLGSRFIDTPDLKIARINTSKKVGQLSRLEMHYTVGTRDGVEHFYENHELGLFTNEQYLRALLDAGLEARFLTQGPKNQELYNRGLYVAVKPVL